jgi:hypothetical protein
VVSKIRLAPSVISLELVAVRVQLDPEILQVACCRCAKGRSGFDESSGEDGDNHSFSLRQGKCHHSIE